MASKRRNRRAHKKKLVLNGPSPINKPGQNQKKDLTIPSNALAAPRGMTPMDLGGPGTGRVPQRTNIIAAHGQDTVTNPGQIGRIIGLAEKLNVLARDLMDAKADNFNLERELANAKARNESYARELANAKAENENYARELANAKAGNESYVRLIDDLGMRIAGLEAWQLDMDTQEKH